MIADDVPVASCLIVGAGPAGLAPLIAAAHSGRLQELLEAGVVIVERSDVVGAGELGRYAISSDSATEAFLDAVMRTEEPRLAALRNHPTVTSMSQYIGGSIPLKMVASYLRLLGETLCDLVTESAKGLVLRRHSAMSTQMTTSGQWVTRVRCEVTGLERKIRTSSVILATGAHQPKSRLYSEEIAGISLLPTYADKVFQSSQLLTRDGLEQVAGKLGNEKDPRVVVVGGSTSGGAAARVLLNECPSVVFGPKAVTLMHRRPLRIFYPSAEEALQDGYTDFGPRDICRVSGRVYRFAGFRLDTRELMMSVMEVGGRRGEPRLSLHLLDDGNIHQTRDLLDSAHIIVAALGYRPRGLPVFAQDNSPVELNGACDAMRAMVDDDCHVLRSNGKPIRGLYSIGLASGFIPRGALGGEESFQGQANSLWLWQHNVGQLIVNGIAQDRMAHPDLRDIQQRRYRVSTDQRVEEFI